MRILHGYSLCMVADFWKWPHFSNIWCFFQRFFAQNNSTLFVEWNLTIFWKFYIWTQREDFAWAITLAWWPTFKMVLFLEYLVFFSSGFLHRTTLNDLWNGFCDVFWNFNFDVKWGFCVGNSLCQVANFQNGLISLIIGVFGSCFFSTEQLYMIYRMDFDMFFRNLIFDSK